MKASDLKLLFNLIRHKLYGLRFPAHVAICITNKCNLKCPYCYYSYNLYKEDRISTPTLFSLIDELHNKGTAYINLNGGEPLLREDLKEIIQYITIEKGMHCSISTNAILLEEKINALKNISLITVSLDGNAEQHRRNREDTNYKKIIKGIEAALRNNISVAICTVLTEDNKDCIGEMAEFAKEKGIFLIFHFLYERLNALDNQQLTSLSMEETERVMQKIIDYKQSGYPIHYSYRVHHYLKDWPHRESRLIRQGAKGLGKNSGIIPCLAGDLFCHIDASGKVWPCAVLSGQVEALNFLEVGFDRAWSFIRQERCQTCAFFHQLELNLLLSLDLRSWLELVISKFIKVGDI